MINTTSDIWKMCQMLLFIYYMHDKIAFFQIQLHFVKSF
jgi:hypothetical protein